MGVANDNQNKAYMTRLWDISRTSETTIPPYLRWVDDSCELLDSKHSQVGDGESASLKLVRLELAQPGSLSKILHVSIDCFQSLHMKEVS